MRNVLFFLSVGWAIALTLYIVGGLFYITIAGIPLAKGVFTFARFYLTPYKHKIVRKSIDLSQDEPNVLTKIWRIAVGLLWLPFFGIPLFLVVLSVGIFCCLTIILIPLGVPILKSCKYILWPVGIEVMSDLDYIANKTANLVVQVSQNQQQ